VPSAVPSRKRIFAPGLTFHVTQRGNNKCATFRDDCDYETFLWSLRFAIRRYTLQVHAYALMTNHFHLMVTPDSVACLSRAMQSLGRRYVRYFNQRHVRTGTLWEGRFRAALITDERYWLTCMRYVELNPVRAGLTERPENYRWCSYRSHAYGAVDPLISTHVLYDGLAVTSERRLEAWRNICAPAMQAQQLEALRRSIAEGIVGDVVTTQILQP
jgi:putative transposase